MKRILILIALLALSASQIAVGQEDGQLGFECFHAVDNRSRFLKANMVEQRGSMWYDASDRWYDEILIVTRNYIGFIVDTGAGPPTDDAWTFWIDRTSLEGVLLVRFEPRTSLRRSPPPAGTFWSNQCTIMSWEEVDQKVTEHMAEFYKDRAF